MTIGIRAGVCARIAVAIACLLCIPPALAQLTLPGLPSLPGLFVPPIDEPIRLSPQPLQPTPGTERIDGTLRQGLLIRRYVLIRPVDAAPGAPVVLMLHAYGSTNALQANMARAGRLAADFGVWVYLPMAGSNRRWTDTPERAGPDDVAFLSALLSRELAEHALDAQRVYGFGFSNGGFMLQRLACERPGLLAGLALVGANLRDPIKASCQTGPLPILFFNGSADPVVYPEGRAAYRFGSLEDLLTFWSTRNQCSGGFDEAALPDQSPDDGTTVILRQYAGCANALRYYWVQGGGHTWPGAPPMDLPALGLTTYDIDATLEGWQVLIGMASPAP